MKCQTNSGNCLQMSRQDESRAVSGSGYFRPLDEMSHMFCSLETLYKVLPQWERKLNWNVWDPLAQKKKKKFKNCLCPSRQIPIINKDIFEGATLWQHGSSTPVWHPLKDVEGKKNCWREGDHKTKSARAPESRVATEKPIGRGGAAAEIAM